MEKVIILVGLPAAGKTTIAENVGKKLGIPLVETSPFVFKSVEERGLPVTPENIRLVSTELKAKSDSYYTEKALEFARKEYQSTQVVFFAGMRAFSEIKYLKKELGADSVVIIGFHASQSTRFKRVSNPDRAGAVGAKAEEDKKLQNFDYFLAREEKELGFGIGSVFALSDYIIQNDDLRFPYNAMKKNEKDFETIVRAFIAGEK
jgi:dephospho-CoA kinase